MNSLFSVTLLRWFAANGRSLPWRERDDAYAIWLSEIILQQTRVEQGRDYWLRFMQRFPTVEALAAATEDEVLRLWQGLGYYSRARNLHAAARQVVAMGGFPRSVEGLRQLKGVGDYTAAAVASMAFNEPAAAVDGNVFRVLARHFGIATAINTTEGRREFTALAAELLPPREAGTFNQAMMDFGATLCTPRSPRCADCPFVETCVARREGRVEELPVKLRKTTIRERRLAYIYIRCKGDTAIHRRGAGDIWQGLWEPVEIESPSLTPPWGGGFLRWRWKAPVITQWGMREWECWIMLFCWRRMLSMSSPIVSSSPTSISSTPLRVLPCPPTTSGFLSLRSTTTPSPVSLNASWRWCRKVILPTFYVSRR